MILVLQCVFKLSLILINRINFNLHMSVELSFQNIQVTHISQVEHNQLHSFTLQILNKQFKQNMKTTFHSINKGVIDLPSNIFILPENAILHARIEQNNQRRQLQRMLSFGEYQFNVDSLQLWDISNNKGSNIKHGTIQFQTFNKNFKIIINYKGMYIKNKTFAGYFFGLLQNQGAQTRNLLTIKQFHDHHHNHEPIEKQLQRTAQTIAPIQTSLKNNSSKLANCFHLCDRIQVDDGLDQVAQQELPEKFSQHIKSKAQSPKMTKHINQSHQISQKLQISPEASTKNKSYQKQKSTEQHPHAHSSKHKAKTLMPLYKGTCKSNNLFSCLDSKTEDYQICVIEPAYKG